MSRSSIVNSIISIIILALLWLTLSGHYDLLHLFYGAVSIALVLIVNHKLKQHYFFDDELDSWSELRMFRAAFYVIWLLREIIMAGLYIATVIMRPRMPVEPYILKFSVDLPNTQAKVILGNSITLTPGTLTVDIDDDEFTVHALTPKSYESLVSDEMPRQVLALFTAESHPVIRDMKIVGSEKETMGAENLNTPA